jgi:hypothetical protein
MYFRENILIYPNKILTTNNNNMCKVEMIDPHNSLSKRTFSVIDYNLRSGFMTRSVSK